MHSFLIFFARDFARKNFQKLNYAQKKLQGDTFKANQLITDQKIK